MNFLDAPVQVAFFYIERIDLAPKLSKIGPKWRWSRPFSGKKFLTNVQTLNHQISLLAGLHTLSNLFHYKKNKTTYSTTLRPFSLYFKFHLILNELSLKFLRSRTKINLSNTIDNYFNSNILVRVTEALHSANKLSGLSQRPAEQRHKFSN